MTLQVFKTDLFVSLCKKCHIMDFQYNISIVGSFSSKKRKSRGKTEKKKKKCRPHTNISSISYFYYFRFSLESTIQSKLTLPNNEIVCLIFKETQNILFCFLFHVIVVHNRHTVVPVCYVPQLLQIYCSELDFSQDLTFVKLFERIASSQPINTKQLQITLYTKHASKRDFFVTMVPTPIFVRSCVF